MQAGRPWAATVTRLPECVAAQRLPCGLRQQHSGVLMTCMLPARLFAHAGLLLMPCCRAPGLPSCCCCRCGLYYLPILFLFSSVGTDLLAFCLQHPEVSALHPALLDNLRWQLCRWPGRPKRGTAAHSCVVGQSPFGIDSPLPLPNSPHCLPDTAPCPRFPARPFPSRRRATTCCCSACAARWDSSSSSPPSSALAPCSTRWSPPPASSSTSSSAVRALVLVCPCIYFCLYPWYPWCGLVCVRVRILANASGHCCVSAWVEGRCIAGEAAPECDELAALPSRPQISLLPRLPCPALPALCPCPAVMWNANPLLPQQWAAVALVFSGLLVSSWTKSRRHTKRIPGKKQ